MLDPEMRLDLLRFVVEQGFASAVDGLDKTIQAAKTLESYLCLFEVEAGNGGSSIGKQVDKVLPVDTLSSDGQRPSSATHEVLSLGSGDRNDQVSNELGRRVSGLFGQNNSPVVGFDSPTVDRKG